MDVDLSPSRIRSTKHFSLPRACTHLNYPDSFDDRIDSEGDDEVRSLFSCPLCYMDIEVRALCIHFQQEHCLDGRNGVCPLCAGNLDGDVTRHYMVHHRASMKWRRKLLKPGNCSSMALGKELSSFLRFSGSSRTLADQPDLPSDVSDNQNVQLDESLDEKALSLCNAEGSKLLQDQAKIQELEKQRGTAAFVQELVASIIL